MDKAYKSKDNIAVSAGTVAAYAGSALDASKSTAEEWDNLAMQSIAVSIEQIEQGNWFTEDQMWDTIKARHGWN